MLHKPYASIRELSFEPVHVTPSPQDWRDQFIYFLLVDRFNDGVDRPLYDPDTTPKDRTPDGGTTYQGGTISGITDRLDYIKGLGATTIWLSPIFKNRVEDDNGYHGYGIQDFLSVDPRFGTLDDLKNLVRKAHARGLSVILDIIINHTGDNWAYAGDELPSYRTDGGRYDFGFWRKTDSEEGLGPDDAVWPVEFQNPDWYTRRGRIGNWEDLDEAQNGDFFGFKELNLRNPDTLNALVDVYSHWIAETDIDGFRIDTVKHISRNETAQFCSRIREFAERIGKHNFFLFGEIIGGDDIIKEYVTPNHAGDRPEYARTLNAALDFPLYFILEEVIKGFLDQSALRDRYDRLKELYPHSDTNEYFVTFVDNHDQVARQWKRFLHNAPHEQAILAIGYLLTAQGIPCIYYGTEQGFNGGDHADTLIRECMFGGEWGAFGTTGAHFFDTSHPLYTAISKIAEVRIDEPSLRHGRQYFRDISRDGEHFHFPEISDGILAYSRILDSEEIVLVLNLADQEQTCSVSVDSALSLDSSSFVDLLDHHTTVTPETNSAGRTSLPIHLEPYQFCIFKKQARD